MTRQTVARWMSHGLDELRAVGPLATTALLTGGSVSSVVLTIVWLLQHHPIRKGRRA